MNSKNLKVLITIIILGIIVAVAWSFLGQKKLISSEMSIKEVSPTQVPTPTLIPIDENTNLEDEVNKLTPEDFSEDFKNLKSKYEF